MNFQIGQKVVCVGAMKLKNNPFIQSGDLLPRKLIIGKTYTVHGIVYCSKCGEQSIFIGTVGEFYNLSGCVSCGRLDILNTNKEFYRSLHFVPLEEYEASEKMVEELLNPVHEKI